MLGKVKTKNAQMGLSHMEYGFGCLCRGRHK